MLKEENTEESELLSGEWKGEYIDVKGYRGKISFRFDVEGKVSKGDCKLTMSREYGSWSVAATIEGETKGSTVSMKLFPYNEETKQKSDKPIEFNAKICKAGSYAQQALIGIVDKIPLANFGGGVCIAWRFKSMEMEK